MNKYFKIALILSLICGLCGGLIAAVNYITEDIIEENNQIKINNSLNELYEGALFEEIDLTDNINESIIKIYKVKKSESEDETIAYIYQVSGKNNYGSIELMIGININKTMEDLIVLSNTQSYKQEVNKHIEDNYQNGLTEEDINNIDVYCGATKGATLAKNLVKISLDHFEILLGDYNG